MDVNITLTLHPNRVSYGYLLNNIVSGILTLLAAICVLLRFLHRHRSRDLSWDDWTILGALIFGMGVFIITVLISMPSIGAAGYHITEYTSDQLMVWAKVRLNYIFLEGC